MSRCKDEDTQIFTSDEYDMNITGFEFDPLNLSRIKSIEITKKKPETKLHWRDITPWKPYSLENGNHGYHFPYDNYRLVQFKLEAQVFKAVSSWDTGFFITNVKATTFYDPNGYILLCKDCLNKWSAPVVIPIDFYEKLDTYVEEFNQKLNCREA